MSNATTTAQTFVNRYNAGDVEALTSAVEEKGADVDQDWRAGATRVVFADASIAVFEGESARVAQYRIEVRGNWAELTHANWAPAVAGTLNQTGTSDAEASTFDSYDAAEDALENVIKPEAFSDLEDGEEDVRRNAPEFRIVEL